MSRFLMSRGKDAYAGRASATRRLVDERKAMPWPKKRVVPSRIDPSWSVLSSLENSDGDRCVDLFRRVDGSFGFEEFRRDVEDQGRWTPVAYYSDARYASQELAQDAAATTVPWLRAHLTSSRALRGEV
jgi:hypothetical protein